MTALPVAIVDDHHHCLPDIHLVRPHGHDCAWYAHALMHCRDTFVQAIRQRRLPFSDIHVLHVDSHPDLSFPAAAHTNVIFQPETLYDMLDDSAAGIAEFLLPLVFAGHVNQITWLKPSWANQMPTGAFKQLAVGKRKTNGAMGVTSELPHFVEDDLYCQVEELEASSVRRWDLFATETSSSDDAAAVETEAADNARHNSKGFILDIDLDYFSTWSPFRKDLEARIGGLAVKTVTQVFSCARYKRAPLDVMTAGQRNTERRRFCELIKCLEVVDVLEDITARKSEWDRVVSNLALLYAEGVDAGKLLDEFTQVLEQYRDDKEVRCEIWDAAPFLDLPHHESSPEEIEFMINELEKFLHAHELDAINPPAIVTIAKSTGDQYLPPHQLDVVLTSVLRMLERVFGKLTIKYVEYEAVEDADDETNTTE